MTDTGRPHISEEIAEKAIECMDITGDDLRIAALREEELPLLLALFNEQGAAGFYVPTMLRPYNLEQLRGLLADWNDRAESFLFAIRQGEELVGIANIDGFSWANSHAEIGIALTSPLQRGHGFAYRSLLLLLDYLFIDVGLNRVFCRIMAGNEASMRLFQKIGFQPEGVMRAHIRRSSHYIDMHFFGLLADEWIESRQKILGKV